MSEFKTTFKQRIEKIRSKKLTIKVDLVPMVSVSFLLIIFFMLTKELSKPQSMDLGMPNQGGCGGEICGGFGENRTLSLLLGDNNKIISYSGIFENPIDSPKEFKYGKDGIRKELIRKNQQIKEYSGDSRKGLIVIIKPSSKSNFKNLVDVLDEMAITKIATYAVVNEYSADETKLLAKFHAN